MPGRPSSRYNDRAVADDELAFLNLVLLLGNLATQRLDGVARGAEGERNARLQRARDVLDMLTGLRKRTQGRLTTEEERVIDTLLRDLQARYVRVLVNRPGPAAA